MAQVATPEDVESEFDSFWTAEREKSLSALCEDEGLEQDKVAEIIANYHFTQRMPLRERIVAALKEKPKILQRKTIIERVRQRLMELIGTFDD